MNASFFAVARPLAILLFFGMCFLVQSPVEAQPSFGRSVPNGNWFDNNWIINGGNLGRPGQFNTNDNVVIGDASATSGAVEPATVTQERDRGGSG